MTRCNTSDRRKWLDRNVFFFAAGLAVILVLGATGTTLAVGLTYVDAMPGSTFGETPNMFRTDGTAIGSPGDVTVVNSEIFLPTDNAWGWADFGATNTIYDPTPGVVDADYTSIYESLAGQENSPEIQMRLIGSHGIAASTSYDVYVAYWSDSTNWAIRAGFQPGTVGSPLPVFASATGTVAGETPGLFAASAAWDSPPLDNPTDENATGATDSNSNPFLDVTPGAPAGSTRNMFLGRIGSITSGSQAGAAADEIRVWIDDLNTGGRRTWIDGLAFVPANTNVFWSAELDRDARSLTVTNDTTQAFTIASYSILSAAGSLNGSGVNNAPWNNATAGTLAGFTDTDNDWAVVGTPTAFSTELREEDGGPGAQNGIVVGPGGVLDWGALWQHAPFQDVQVVLRLADATPADFTDNPIVTVFPTYSGAAHARGDFTGDGTIGVADYITLMQNLHKPQPTLTRTEYYRNGDYNDDNLVNRNDFILFRTAYLQANGGGAGGFAAMASEAARLMSQGVPEPSSLLLAALGGGFFCLRPRRRALTQPRALTQLSARIQPCDFNKDTASMNQGGNWLGRLGVAGVALVVGCVLTAPAQAVPVTGWQCEMTLGNCDDDSQITNPGTNSPILGNGTLNSADDMTFWGSTPNIALTDGSEAVLTGRVRFIGAVGASGRDFRWGMWKDTPNDDPDETHSWLGYLAGGGSGGTPGRLYVRNPDNGGFATTSFVSNAGDTSIGTSSGPCPTAGCNTQFVDDANAGTSPGLYFLLAETPVTNNATFDTGAAGVEPWYNFEIRVGRYGAEVTSSGRLYSDPQSAVGDYNNDSSVDAADYTVWRNNVGQPATNLLNRDPANAATTVDESHYSDWTANYGDGGQSAYDLRMGGGLDFNGNPPPNLTTNPAGTYSDHLTFDFDRVGFLVGNQMNADQVDFSNIDISTNVIQTINLHVNTATGAVNIRNLLGTPFEINYYEISSTLGVLELDNWNSFDEADGGSPATNDYLEGWDEAGGASDFNLSEGNFVGSTTVTMGTPIPLGSVFKTSTLEADRDLRFFVGLTNGDVIRGTITYATTAPGGGGLAGVPEPSTLWLLLVAGGGLLAGRRR